MHKLWIIVCVAVVEMSVLGCRVAESPKSAAPYILGADVTYVLEDEAAGVQFFDGGQKKDFFQILKDNKFNYVRLTSVVEPAPNFARGDLEHLKIIAKRATAANLGLLVDFFYSDTWASPENQPKPAVWKNLSFAEMVTAVHDHTKAVLMALKAQGTLPQMVQIGNEITFGMVWPDGRVTSKISTGNPTTDAHNASVTDAGGWDHFAALLRAGISATKEVDPNIKIMLHHSLARNDALVHEWIDNLRARDVQFDIVGLSCYAQHAPNDWKTTFDDIATNYPNLGIIAVEYSGQKKYLNDLVFNSPNHRGLGSFIWSPTRDHEALFDHQAPTTLPSELRNYNTNQFMKIYPQLSRDYGNP